AAYKQMKTLADLGGGNVLVPDAYERLKVTFDDEPPEQDEEEEPEEAGITYPLEVFDDVHFITRGIALQGDVAGFNDVTDKAGAKRLVTTDKGKPIVTVWNFGLGHVAAVTTDDGRAWGGVLYAGDNARLMPTTINWAIRNPMPDIDGTITADDVWLGDDGAVSVQSSSVPTVTYQGTDVNLVRVVADIYRGSITPKNIGFSTIGGYGVATNYPLEYRDVGFNDNVAASVTQSGGYVYTPEEAREKLFDDVKKSAERASVEPVDQSMMFILAALVLYFMEIAIRRIGEIMRMKRENKYHNEKV
ncbi:MAG: hypothetical protein KAH86_05130, partial [Methanosarcinales archaeon]|nr:hypothetical protein [Methanosarcinales archaeon]